MNNISYVKCPHCNMLMEIPHQEINCAIYRHAVLKTTHQQLDPHAPKKVCDYLAQQGLIYGCGKPFQVIRDSNNNITVAKCDYI